MHCKINTFLIVLLLLVSIPSHSQDKIDPKDIQEKMQWFADAKLGIFIHAGIYSVDGVGESWSFHNKQIPYADYMKQLDGFTLSQYNPAYWADLISETGARYAVITTKHHDGVAMYNTRLSDLSIVKSSPAQIDMIGPFYKELRKRDLKCGAYFSLIDWSRVDYPGFLKDSARYKIDDDSLRWNNYKEFMQGQINEIQTQYNPDLWWFDGDWEQSAERWGAGKIRSTILTYNPGAIIRGLSSDIESIQVVGSNAPLKWKIVGKISWSEVPGLVYIEAPVNDFDQYLTVIKVNLTKPLKLYRGEGGLGL